MEPSKRSFVWFPSPVLPLTRNGETEGQKTSDVERKGERCSGGYSKKGARPLQRSFRYEPMNNSRAMSETCKLLEQRCKMEFHA